MDKESILNHLPLVTKRLIIRPITPDDLDGIQIAKEQQEEVLRRWMSWSDDHGISRAGLDEFLELSGKSNMMIPLFGFDKLTGKFVIASGLDATEPDFKTIHTGWWLAKGYEGQGLAFEAMQKIYVFMEEVIGTKKVEAQFYQGNIRSRNLMERLGMQYVETTPKAHTSHLTGELLDVIKYELRFE